MATELENAELSNRVYKRTDENRTPVPEGWTELRWLPDAAFSGFSAGVYRKGNEIVIAYTGTNEGKAADFLMANIPLGLGVTSTQVYQAMLLYFETKAQHPEATISFTGHSLGGGLASMMAVFFDLDATIFDPAPFELAARNPASLTVTLATMAAMGYSDAAFSSYVASGGLTFGEREQGVNAVSLEGEALAALRAIAPTIYGGTERVVPIGTQSLLAGSGTDIAAARIDLHSMTLLVAMLRSTAFAQAIQGNSQSLALIFDGGLYKRDTETSDQPNFLDRLLLADMGNAVAGTTAHPVLDRFAADLQRIGSAGVVAQADVLKALTVAAMEYYYFKDPAQANKLFTVADGGLHFDFDDIGQPQLALKSPRLLADAMKPYLSDAEWSAAGLRLPTQDAWHVHSGAGGMTWTASAAAYDAAIGGAGTDVLDAGAGDDILIGGAGQDFLTGGTGADILVGGLGVDSLYGGGDNDRLMGGAEADIYNFSGVFGSDVIEDADGQIQIGGTPLDATGAKKTSPTSNTWKNSDATLTYSLVQASATRQDLVITATGADAGSITIRNWTNGQLGITLGSEVAQPPTTLAFTGDFVKKTMEGDPTFYVFDNDFNYVPDPNGQPGAQPDLITGSGGGDDMSGGAGNDGLSGFSGDDVLSGGAGTIWYRPIAARLNSGSPGRRASLPFDSVARCVGFSRALTTQGAIHLGGRQ